MYEHGLVHIHKRRKLPHWNAEAGVQFVTIDLLRGFRLSHDDARIVVSTVEHHDLVKYELLTYCVMPNHLHVVFQPFMTIAKIVQSWKTYTARAIGGGRLWQTNYFDRLVRDRRELSNVLDYVYYNPDAASLPENWDFRRIYLERCEL